MADQIPIRRAEKIARAHGYDQVIIYARQVGDNGQEWVTTYGVDSEHSNAAARIGDCIRRQVVQPLEEMRRLVRLADAIRTTQRAYLQDRGNEAKGRAVAAAAETYDSARAQIGA